MAAKVLHRELTGDPPAPPPPPARALFGAGPANVDPRVSRALAAPLVGHLDPYFLQVMDETMAMLRQVFRTTNHHTIPMSATGSGGLGTNLLNPLGPGGECGVGVVGVFGARPGA